MPELTFRSPGVSTREIDLSGPRRVAPVGTPAGVIGTADDGPAFVPITVGSYSDFTGLFGASDGEKFGPLAVNEWLKNATSCTYVRVLGVGDGKKKNSSTGKVTNAGFVVGTKQVQANGVVNENPFANSGGVPGRTYFLGAFMSESNGSTVFSDAGIQATAPTSGKQATAVNAIDTNGAYAGINGGTDVKFTINVPATAGGEGGVVTIVLEDGDDTGAAGAGANQIGIGGSSGLGDPSWQNLVLAAINNDTSSGRITMATSGRGTAGITGVTATDGTSTTQTTLTIDAAGAAGNSAVLASTAGANIIDVTAFTGGADGNHAVPIIRGILMAPSGVTLALSGNYTYDSSAPATTLTASARWGKTVESGGPDNGGGQTGNLDMRGAPTGSVKLGSQEFVMLLNGHKGSSLYPRVVTASFDMRNQNYFGNVFNTDSTKIEEAGHLLYGRYDIHPALAAVTGAGVLNVGATKDHAGFNDAVFITYGSGSGNANSGASNRPNYESFESRYTTAFSPYVISQDFGGSPYDVFRVEALSDGAVSTDRFKISIENIKKTNSDTDKFGSFDIVVRAFSDTDELPVVLEAFRGVDLDPTSGRFVARIVGDQKAYFNFDANSGAQKLVVEGDYPNNSRLIRIKQSTALKKSEIPDEGLPMGFRGPYHLVTSGSTQLAPVTGTLNYAGVNPAGSADIQGKMVNINRAVEPPLPFRETVAMGTGQTKRAKSSLYWGVQFSNKEDLSEPNKVSLFNSSMNTYAKFFPRFEGSDQDFSVGDNAGAADSGGVIFDSDRFNNNKFSLEKLQVRTGSDTLADPSYWLSASYTRKGTIVADETNKTRAFKVDDLKSAANRNFAKFTFFLQGGFDGTNIFNKDKMKLTNAAAIREMDDATAQGATSGPTVASFRKAIDIMGNTSDVSIKLLAIPGIRETGITDYAIDAVESRFDALYIMDIEERDTLNTVVTSSAQVVHVKNTTTDFTNRALDTSFAAAYFPDVIQRDPGVGTNIQVPPSVAVLGAFALNDAIGHPWFAPAGFSRGALNDAQRAAVELKRSNLDDLYDVDVNPITDFPGTGLVVFGQKTLLAAASALDRVNVRRLLIEIRRNVRAVANTLLFEPNRQTTLDKFNALVNPILQGIQEKNGLARFKVIIDTTTTTQADVENNTIRGKIFVQPTRTIEFIALDFVVTNAGAGA